MAASYKQRKALGDYGEELACSRLVDEGYTVVDRNWRCDEGEIDVVAIDDDVVVVCEVKTRSSDAFGTPLEAITPHKAARLNRLGWRWMRDHRVHGRRLRVDVMAIVLRRGGEPAIEHIVGVS